MKLIQLFLPLYNNSGILFPDTHFGGIKAFLLDKFGGVTLFSRSPAIGLWKEDSTHTIKDDIVIFEVMAESVESEFWIGYKKQLEELFTQEEILIRVSDITVIKILI